MALARDRDPAGRPLNARPRDALGRPLPRGEEGVERLPEGLTLPADEALAEAQRLLDDGMPFHAHEVLESAWKAAPGPERDLWQGLAQIAVGLTHLLRGNPAGAVAVLRRGRERISPYAANPPHAIDVTGLVSWVDSAVSAAGDASAGPVSVAAPRLVRNAVGDGR